jgi:hypothetical protein
MARGVYSVDKGLTAFVNAEERRVDQVDFSRGTTARMGRGLFSNVHTGRIKGLTPHATGITLSIPQNTLTAVLWAVHSSPDDSLRPSTSTPRSSRVPGIQSALMHDHDRCTSSREPSGQAASRISEARNIRVERYLNRCPRRKFPRIKRPAERPSERGRSPHRPTKLSPTPPREPGYSLSTQV